MNKDFVRIANGVMTGVGMLRQGSPDTMKAFAALSTAATASNTIDTKTKELMALAIGIAVHCDGCVAYHTRWRISTAPRARRFLRQSHLQSTWAADRRRSTAPTRSVPTTSSATRQRPREHA